MVSRSNAIGGGASRIAEELAFWLSNEGYHVTHFCAHVFGPLEKFQTHLYPEGYFGKISRATHRFTRKCGFNEIAPIEFFAVMHQILDRFDVIHFHDLYAAISPLSLYLCSRKKPVVFTAHDCSCFTGGCIYPLMCRRYLKQCGKCPQLTSIGAFFDFTRVSLNINRFLAKSKDVRYVFPSDWLRNIASSSLTFANSPKVIPNGFSACKYVFRSKSVARRELGIRDEQRVIIVAAHYLADPRKGLSYALAAIESIRDLDPLIIFIGYPPQDLEDRLPGMRFWLAGFVKDRIKLGLLIAAADLFLFTSLQDNFPIMVQEALSAGTLVVGFAAGGVSEMVEHEGDGRLCAPGDQVALNRNLRNSLMPNGDPMFVDVARSSSNEKFDMNLFGQRHLALYEEIVR